MKLKKRLKWPCGEEITTGEICRNGYRCSHCFDKLVAWCEIEYMITALKEITKAQYNADSKDIANEALDRLKKSGQI